MPAGVMVFPMKRTENSAWYLCRVREQVADGRCDEIGRLLHRTNAEIDLMAIIERSEDEAIRALAGSALIKLRADGKVYSGTGLSTDIIGASIRAYISTLNKIVYDEQT